MKEIISKNGVVKCVSNEPHPPEIIKMLKKAGYKIKRIDDTK